MRMCDGFDNVDEGYIYSVASAFMLGSALAVGLRDGIIQKGQIRESAIVAFKAMLPHVVETTGTAFEQYGRRR